MPAPTTRTRRESAPPRVKSSGGGGIFLLVLAGLLVIGGGIFALIYFLGDSPKTDNEMLAYLPHDSTLIVVIDGNELLKANKLMLLPQNLPGSDWGVLELVAKEKLSPDNIAYLAVGMRDFRPQPRPVLMPGSKAESVLRPNAEGEYASMVFRTKQSVDKAKLIAAWSGREEKKGNKTYYVLGASEPRAAVPNLKCFFPSDTLIVFTRNDKVLEKIIAADATKTAFSAEMQDVIRRVNHGPIWFAMTRRALQETTYTRIKDEGAFPYLTSDTAEAIKDLQAFGGWFKVNGDRLDFTVNLVCSDAAIAARTTEKLKKLVAENRDKNVNENDDVKAFKKKHPAIAAGVWNACNDIQRTAIVGLNGNAIELSATIGVDSLDPVLSEFLYVRSSAQSRNSR